MSDFDFGISLVRRGGIALERSEGTNIHLPGMVRVYLGLSFRGLTGDEVSGTEDA